MPLKTNEHTHKAEISDVTFPGPDQWPLYKVKKKQKKKTPGFGSVITKNLKI